MKKAILYGNISVRMVTRMYTKEDIIRQLNELSVPKGALIHMHASLRAVGDVSGGAEELLDILIEYFTKDGGIFTLPTHTWAFSKDKDRYTLDLMNPDTCVGTLPKLALSRPDGFRSMHPTHSVVAFGKGAEDFVSGEENSETTTPPHGCYGKLYNMDGYVLLVGVGHNRNTFIHHIEEILNVPNRISKNATIRTVRLPDGSVLEKLVHGVYADGIGAFWERFPKFEPVFRCFGAVTDGFIGDAPVQLCSCRKMMDAFRTVFERSGRAELLLNDEPFKEEWYK